MRLLTGLGLMKDRALVHITSVEGHIDATRLLIQRGADINALDRWGNTPLSDALDFSQHRVAQLLR